MILDTTFLIDLEREIIGKTRGAATGFLMAHSEGIMRISVITLGELAEGYTEGSEAALMELVDPYEIVEMGREIAIRYGRISRSLRADGIRIGDNDIWIAATAAELSEPLVTRDRGHFERILGLIVLQY